MCVCVCVCVCNIRVFVWIRVHLRTLNLGLLGHNATNNGETDGRTERERERERESYQRCCPSMSFASDSSPTSVGHTVKDKHLKDHAGGRGEARAKSKLTPTALPLTAFASKSGGNGLKTKAASG